MEITSIEFLLFAAVCIGVYLVLPKKVQWIFLLAASLVFYMASGVGYTLIYVIISVLSVYIATIFFEKIDGAESVKNKDGLKKLIMLVALLENLGVLAVLKYTNLGIEIINWFSGKSMGAPIIEPVSFVAPIAISYYTLQLIAYLLDCYWGTIKPEKNFGRLFLYAIYFPQMVSGPISRFKEIGTQLFEEHRFDYERIKKGLIRMAYGFFEKLAVAGPLSTIVTTMYDNLGRFNGAYIWALILIFPLELYADFKGCMDIVLGISECIGIHLPENFNAPFFSKSVQEFWQKWHMSLGHFLRDYIMTPILMSKPMKKLGKWAKKKFGRKEGKKIPSYFGLFAVWTCMGIWHGSGVKFIIGEGWWFFAIIFLSEVTEPLFKKIKSNKKTNGVKSVGDIKSENNKFIGENKIADGLRIIRTIILFAIGNVFFIAKDMSQALQVFRQAFDFRWVRPQEAFIRLQLDRGLNHFTGVVILIVGIILMIIFEYMQHKGRDFRDVLSGWKAISRWSVYILIVSASVIYMFGNTTTFIYQGF